ncbi:MAG TPA: MFS transporter [Steroidobacteraceae bacterium]|nr:MFS transporter [Steroidobacteraceae bacterium]
MTAAVSDPAPRAREVSTGIVVLLALAVFINYVDRGNLATAGPLLKDALHLSNSQMGVLLSAFFWAYAPGQLPAGWLAQRLNVRYVLAVGLALWSFSTVLTGFVSTFAAMLMLRLLLGAGESVFHPCNAKVLAEQASEHRRGVANGMISAGQSLGSTFGTLFGGLLMAALGWRWVFIVAGLLSLVWLAPWLWSTRGNRVRAPVLHGSRQPVPYLAIFKRRALWASSLGSFTCYYGYYFVLTWLPLYLVKARGLSVVHMAQVAALVFCMHSLAALSCGWISDRWIKAGGSVSLVRKSILITGTLGAGIATLFCTRVGLTACVALLFTAAWCLGMQNPQVFAVAQRLGGSRAAGKWMAVQNMLGNVAGIAAPLITGITVDRSGGYGWAFAITAAIAGLGVFAWGLALPPVETVRWADELGTPAAPLPAAT